MMPMRFEVKRMAGISAYVPKIGAPHQSSSKIQLSPSGQQRRGKEEANTNLSFPSSSPQRYPFLPYPLNPS
jgi:hypothetical protein